MADVRFRVFYIEYADVAISISIIHSSLAILHSRFPYLHLLNAQ